MFDKHGNGMVSVHDMKLSLTTLGERLGNEELDELVREVDKDAEGQVSFEGKRTEPEIYSQFMSLLTWGLVT